MAVLCVCLQQHTVYYAKVCTTVSKVRLHLLNYLGVYYSIGGKNVCLFLDVGQPTHVFPFLSLSLAFTK